MTDAPDVFAVEPTTVQLSWSRLGAGRHTVTAGPAEVIVDGGGARACTLTGLTPGTSHPVEVDGRVVASATTLVAPPGALRSRIATISDLHLGERAWGYLPRLRDERPDQPLPPTRCLAAALDEIAAWRPDLLVVKGDITSECRRAEFEEAARLLCAVSTPVLVMPGNHDGGNHRGTDAAAVLGELGIDLVTDITAVDLPGVRVVAVPTVEAGRGTAARLGGLGRERVGEAVTGAPGGVLVCTHHQARRRPLLTYWPPGMGWRESRRLLGALATAHPATVLAAGHTHRNRRWRHGPVIVSEVGSVKDYPGTWGAYSAYDGGIVQSVRRVEAPAAIEWTERGRSMLFGVWGRYAPGRLADRCFSHTWP